MSVDLKTLRVQKLCKKCKPEVNLEDGMFDCEKCDKMSSEIAISENLESSIHHG